MRRLIELITGHSNLNYVQHKIDPVNVSPLCRFCEEEDETFAHLLNECPCFISYLKDILHNVPIILKHYPGQPNNYLNFHTYSVSMKPLPTIQHKIK